MQGNDDTLDAAAGVTLHRSPVPSAHRRQTARARAARWPRSVRAPSSSGLASACGGKTGF